MVTNPTLIKRPVLDTGDKLIIGFKVDHYQIELL
jgi:arsenate reductase-like glutaredoxin family protein